MSYGRNFGFRKSDESMRSGTNGEVRIGSLALDPADFNENTVYGALDRTPVLGLKQGQLVVVATRDEFDGTVNVEPAPANTPLIPGHLGLLVQEEAAFIDNDTDPDVRSKIYPGLATLWTGAGIQVWYQEDGRTDWNFAVGTYVAWDGSNWVAAPDATTAVGIVTSGDVQNHETAMRGDYFEMTLLA